MATAQSFIGQEIQNADKSLLANELRNVQIFSLNSRALLKTVQDNPAETPIHLQFGESRDWQIQLQLDPIQSPDYQFNISDETGIRYSTNQTIQTYRGKIVGSNTGTCYLTLAAGFIYGVFEINNQAFFIEPARRFNQQWGEDQYLFYESSDILPNSNGRCAGALHEEKSEMIGDLEKSAGKCYTVELAIAADYQMYDLFGDTSLVEKYVLAILNSVRSNYDDEFNHEVRFQLVTLWLSACPTCNPWSATNNYEALLSNFRTWGNAGKFGKKYDLATLWTGRTLTDRTGANIGGGGYYAVLCGGSRYNVLRRYSENAGLMRSLQAHEFGHNLNADHDSTNSQTIMAPLIRDVKEWSTNTKLRINAYLSTAINLSNCLTECAAPTLPTVDFFTLQSSGCAPFTVQFYNTSSSNATDWEWTFGNNTTSTEANPLATFVEPGFYTIKLRASNAAGGTELVKTAMIQVKGPPKTDFTINYTPGETTAMLRAMVAADSLSWHLHNGDTSQERFLTLSFETDGNYLISLLAYNECGADTLTQVVNVVTMPKASFVANNVIGCAPLQVQFDNQSSANAATFAWEFPGGKPANSAERNPVVTYEQPGVYSVALVVRNAAGSVTARQSNLVQVNRVPKAGFSFRVDGNVASFRNLTESGSTYIWHFGDGTSGNWTNPEHAYAVAGLYTTQLIAANVCGKDTVTKVVEIIGAAPIATFAANVKTGCAPLTVTFNDLSQNEPDGRKWIFSSGTPATSTQANPVVQYTQPGTYPVWMEVVNDFGKDTLMEQNFVTVTNKPEATFTWTIEQLKVAFRLSNQLLENQHYEWHFGDGKSSKEPTPIHQYDTAGNYKVALLVSNTCGSDTLQQSLALITTATTTLPLPFEAFRLFPNPNAGSFQLSLIGIPQRQLTIRIVNALGQELQRTTVDFSTGNLLQPIDLKTITSGIYWLEVLGETGRVAQSFVVGR